MPVSQPRPDQDIRADVRVPRHAAEHAAERFVRHAAILHAAARLMHQRQHAVDVRIRRQRCGVEPPGDVFAHRGRTIHGRDDGDVIPRSRPAVRAAVTSKGSVRDRRWRRGNFGAVFVVLRQRAGGQVVRMHPLAGCDRLRRHANRMAVADDALAFADRRQRDLVAKLDVAREIHRPSIHGDPRPRWQWARGDADVIARMNMDGVGERHA